jgi:hypothetical protein
MVRKGSAKRIYDAQRMKRKAHSWCAKEAQSAFVMRKELSATRIYGAQRKREAQSDMLRKESAKRNNLCCAK